MKKYDESFNEYYLLFICYYFYNNVLLKLVQYSANHHALWYETYVMIQSVENSINLLKKEIEISDIKFKEEFLYFFQDFEDEFEAYYSAFPRDKNKLLGPGRTPKVLSNKKVLKKLRIIEKEFDLENAVNDEDWDESLIYLNNKFQILENFDNVENQEANEKKVSLADEIEKLNELKKSGVISDDEFDKAKARLLES